MKINDKIIVGFLVATGMFSNAIAVKYVTGLTSKQKSELLPIAEKVKSGVYSSPDTGPMDKYQDPKA